jgi:hypothetical protein
LLENRAIKRRLAAGCEIREVPMANASRTPLVVAFLLPPAPPGTTARWSAAVPDRQEDGIVDRVRAEFNEMCGFSPTCGQAARLFGLTRDECARVLDALVREGFLGRDADGRYHVLS